MRGLNLKGRVVGYNVPHLLHPSQVEECESLETTRTRWARVVAHLRPECQAGTVVVRSIHNDDTLDRVVFAHAIHTVMPEGYQHV